MITDNIHFEDEIRQTCINIWISVELWKYFSMARRGRSINNVVNKPLVFQPLKFYCIYSSVMYLS